MSLLSYNVTRDRVHRLAWADQPRQIATLMQQAAGHSPATNADGPTPEITISCQYIWLCFALLMNSHTNGQGERRR